MLTDGALRVFALFDKPDPLEGPFFEETIYVTPSRAPADVQARIVDHVRRGRHALGLSHGPVHAECRVTPDGDVYVLEVAARPIGGLCSRVLTFREGSEADPGAASKRCCCEHAVGDRSTASYARGRGRRRDDDPDPAPRDATRASRARTRPAPSPGVTDIRITAKAGQLLEPLPEAGSYLGFIFARGATPAGRGGGGAAAHEQLTFAIAAEACRGPGSGSTGRLRDVG